MKVDDLFPNDALSRLILLDADVGGEVEDEQASVILVLAGHAQQAMARLRRQCRAIGERKTGLQHSFMDNIVKEIEAVAIDLLVRFVVTDQGAAEVGGDDRGISNVLLLVSVDEAL